ncbi:Ubiquitin carboxyl-terminal hydrolase 36 [Quaeritorhiza haematococci]|nr:Ubiquitin carboxyl-terminal hydrolase 36 [Quaeritorhiza haematococci]
MVRAPETRAPPPPHQQRNSKNVVEFGLFKQKASLLSKKLVFIESHNPQDLGIGKGKHLNGKYEVINPQQQSLSNGSNTKRNQQKNASGNLVESQAANDYPSTQIFSENVAQSWSKVWPIGPGLVNFGNTCFLNSVLQCLTYTPPLASYLLTGRHGQACKVSPFCLMCELEKHVSVCFHSNNSSNKRAIGPKSIVGRLRQIAKHMRVGRQEDAHEFMRYFVEALQKNCLHGFEKADAKVKETTLVYKIFGGYLQSQVHCLACGNKSNTFDPLLDISLELRNCDSIEKCLQQFTKPETLTKDNRYKCTKCKKLVDAKKRITIHRAPPILTIQLKRFDFTRSMFGGKINKVVKFGETLDMTSYMSSPQQGRDLYELYAVLVHAGSSCSSGHYYCYVRNSNNVWYLMNDTEVRQVSLATVLKQSAYILFYTRKTPTQKKPTEKKPTKPAVDDTSSKIASQSSEASSSGKSQFTANGMTNGVSKEPKARVNGFDPMSFVKSLGRPSTSSKSEPKSSAKTEPESTEAESEVEGAKVTGKLDTKVVPTKVKGAANETRGETKANRVDQPSSSGGASPNGTKGPVTSEHQDQVANGVPKVSQQPEAKQKEVQERRGFAVETIRSEVRTSAGSWIVHALTGTGDVDMGKADEVSERLFQTNVFQWDEVTDDVKRKREEILKTSSGSFKRPNSWDTMYDRGKVKKRKTRKSVWEVGTSW